MYNPIESVAGRIKSRVNVSAASLLLFAALTLGSATETNAQGQIPYEPSEPSITCPNENYRLSCKKCGR